MIVLSRHNLTINTLRYKKFADSMEILQAIYEERIASGRIIRGQLRFVRRLGRFLR